MQTTVVSWAKIGISALTFILIGKMLFSGHKVPILGPIFAAA